MEMVATMGMAIDTATMFVPSDIISGVKIAGQTLLTMVSSGTQPTN